MKKITFTLVFIALLCTVSFTSFSNPSTTHSALPGDKEKNNSLRLSIAANRNNGHAELHFKATKGGEATIVIEDEKGNVVSQQKNQFAGGSINKIAIKNLLQLNEGFYTVRLTLNNKTYSSRLLLWK